MASKSYLHQFVKKAREYLPPWLFEQLHKHVLPHAGAHARWNSEPTYFEKLGLSEMHPEVLAECPQTELTNSWRRLHQWYSNAKKNKAAVEPFVNAAAFVLIEAKKRKLEFNTDTELARQAATFKKSLKPIKKEAVLTLKELDLHDYILVPDFVSIVGSTAKGTATPESDVDVCFRARRDEDREHFLIQAENVWLPVRNAFKWEIRKALHFLDNPQGPHGDHVPLFDLVLRPKAEIARRIVKEDYGYGEEDANLEDGFATRVDLGCGDAKPEGYIGLDRVPGEGVDVVSDLNDGLPFSDDSVDEFRAVNLLEHLVDMAPLLAEAYRALKPGGAFNATIPEDRVGTFGAASVPFSVGSIEKGEAGKVLVTLRKPLPIEKVALSPGQAFTPPKPAMAGYTEAYSTEELKPWFERMLPVAVEPKWNGFRVILEKKGEDSRLWFEGSHGINRIDRFPEIRDALKKVGQDFIADADIAIERNGKRLARPEFMALNTERPEIPAGDKVVITFFDLPYLDEDMSDKPFDFRRPELVKFFDQFKGSPNFALSPMKEAKDMTEVKTETDWAFGFDRSEGAVYKALNSAYATDGVEEGWAKAKRAVEIKAIVLGVTKNAAGGWNYNGGIGSPGKYVDLGQTFNTKLEAKEGDILTVQVQEIIPGEKPSWVAATVLDIDSTRKSPYAINQVLDLARRGGILQDKGTIRKIFADELPLDRVVALVSMGAKIAKADPEPAGEGETSGVTAAKVWEKDWWKFLPKSKEGRFVYQHHWRGLPEDLINAPENTLLGTSHSLHGDLRLEGNESLWGFTAFLGLTSENRPKDKITEGKDVRGSFKMPQPKGWLDVGKRKPFVVEPGGVGATSGTYSKFFVEDSGTYRMGFAKESLFEIFLNGKILKGRYLIERISDAPGDRVWVMTRPEDQTPFVESKDFAKEVELQKQKDRKWVYWPALENPLVNVEEFKPERVKVMKADEEKRLVYGIVMRPNVVDVHKDIISREELEKTAHYYLANKGVVGDRHSKVAKVEVVESYIAPVSFKLGDGEVKEGDWVLVTHILDDDLWAKVKSGEYQAYSPGGFGLKTPVK